LGIDLLKLIDIRPGKWFNEFMKNIPYTITEAKKSISDSLDKHHIDSLHGWLLLAKIADSPFMREYYDETVRAMQFSPIIKES
jgi:hypothetical protein